MFANHHTALNYVPSGTQMRCYAEPTDDIRECNMESFGGRLTLRGNNGPFPAMAPSADGKESRYCCEAELLDRPCMKACISSWVTWPSLFLSIALKILS